MMFIEDYVIIFNVFKNYFVVLGLINYMFLVVKMFKDGSDWLIVVFMIVSNQCFVVFILSKMKEVSEGIVY